MPVALAAAPARYVYRVSPPASAHTPARYFGDAERARDCAIGLNKRHRWNVPVHVLDRQRLDAPPVLIGTAIRDGDQRYFKLAGLAGFNGIVRLGKAKQRP